ncbi:MAG: hypothetical protein ACUVTY_10640 [Armatimonadota bacterium]
MPMQVDDIEAFIQLLRQDPELRRRVFLAILPEEFYALPAKMDKIEQDVTELRREVAELRAGQEELRKAQERSELVLLAWRIELAGFSAGSWGVAMPRVLTLTSGAF